MVISNILTHTFDIYNFNEKTSHKSDVEVVSRVGLSRRFTPR